MSARSTDVTPLVDSDEQRRRIKATDLVEAFFARIAAVNDSANALIRLLEDQAYADAQQVDQQRAIGEPLPLDGLPMVVKDNIDVRGVVSASGSLLLKNRAAERDASVVRRLRRAGAVVLAKAHCTELMFSMRAHPELPFCTNPWDHDRIPGASSSGSGAALALDECVAALGTDTGGSVRLPATFCGVSALRPTYGTVSSRGVFPIARSFDTVGPMARSVADVAAVFTAVVGYDKADSRSVREEPEPEPVEVPVDLRQVRIGISRDFFFENLDPEVAAAVERAIEHLAQQGAAIEEIHLPGIEQARQNFITFHLAEALSLHRDALKRTPELFSDYVRERLQWATRVTGADLADAVEGMHKWRRQVEAVFDGGVDALLSPTAPCLPPLVAEAQLGRHLDITRLTYPLSFARVPILCVPCGASQDGLSIGMELAAAPYRDRYLLRIGATYQMTTKWHQRRPPQFHAVS